MKAFIGEGQMSRVSEEGRVWDFEIGGLDG